MNNLVKILACPWCKNDFSAEDNLIKCCSCGRKYRFIKNTLAINLQGAALARKYSKKELIHEIIKRLAHPIRLPPLSILNKKRVERLYDSYLNDRNIAESFRRNYLPKEFRNREGLVLDFGCGRGRHSAMLAQCGFDVIGMDHYATDYWNSISSAKFINGKAEDLRFLKDAIFDLCLCMAVLMYIEDDIAVIQELRRILKKDGFLILQVINKENLRTRLTGKILLDEPVKRYYTIEEIKEKLNLGGFDIASIWTEEFYFPFFTQFLQFVFEVLLPGRIIDNLSKSTPPRLRGVINVIAKVRK